MMIPAVTSSFTKTTRIIAKIRLARTVIAIERFRLKYKKLPEKLTELVPEFLNSVPLDPFDGKPIRYSNKLSYENLYQLKLVERPKQPSGTSQFGFSKPSKDKFQKPPEKPTVDGYYVYSIDSNLEDNGGTPEYKLPHPHSDITYTVICTPNCEVI